MAKAKKHAVGAARAALLRAASTLFAQRGFEGASTHEIAARARVPQGLVRHYFGSKEALWREVVSTGLGDLNAAIEQAAGSRHPLADPAAAWAAALFQQRELVHLLLHALFEPGSRRNWMIAELSACAPARALIAWAGDAEAPPQSAGAVPTGEDPAQLTDQDALLICVRVAGLCAVPVLLPVLETLRGHAIDAAAVARVQCDASASWTAPALRGGAPLRGPRVHARGAGPWSLAAAAQRRMRTAKAP